MEHVQLAKYAATTMKSLMTEINNRIGAISNMNDYFTSKIGYVQDEIKLDRDYFTCEIGYVSKRLDTAKDYNGKTDTTIIQLAQIMDATQKPIESVKDKLQLQQLHQSKSPPKNNVRQPDIVPPDIMNIDTVTSIIKVTLSSTVLKTKSKTVHFNEIADVKIIKCRPYSQMTTAKKNKRKLDNSDNNRFSDCPS